MCTAACSRCNDILHPRRWLAHCPPPQAEEEYFAVKWSVDGESGAPLLLLAGKRALLHVINCATGVLEAVGVHKR